MNFAVLSPEANSARILSGPGPGPLLAAAAAWDGIGQELAAAASAFSSLTSDLAGAAWQGPSAAAMASVATSYVRWLGSAASGAVQTARQAATSAAVFEAARTATVPLELVAANRSALMSMVAANVFGLNAPAIAAIEAQYEQMWAQNVGAMFGYHVGVSEALSGLAPWQEVLSGVSGRVASALEGTSAAAVAALGPTALTAAGSALPAAATDVTLVIGGSGFPIPSQSYVDNVVNNFVTPNFPSFTVSNAISLFTPAESYWITGIKTMTEDASWAEGLTILDTAIKAQLAAGNNVVVQGYSQGAGIASLEMSNLKAAGVPTGSVSFSLIGNAMNPNGGLYERFAGLVSPSLGKTFWGATPDNYYTTDVYTLEYDGFADFPRYPLNFVSDLNAIMGIYYVHTQYPTLTAAQVATAFTLPTEGATMTTYHMIPTENLPLLEPLRGVPFIGNTLADLVQPDLKVLVNLGYGDPNYGYSTGPANVPTPFGLFPDVAPATVFDALVAGTQQGISDAAADIGAWQLPSLPDISLSGISNALGSDPWSALSNATLPTLSVSTIENAIKGVQTATTDIANTISFDATTAYATLLPTADVVNAMVTTLPAYNLKLFLDGILQVLDGDPAGLIYALGAPIAADTALVTLLAGFNLYAYLYAFNKILPGVL
ncbi:PPE family protein [Mycobacterium marinum]|uniref:PPE family protein n=1 Tax=Mycobacterium marinum TaxID=1781 RepID=UPI0003588093|nr:PPE family protein [Mycobacterium marinum]AXN43345.1 putative PPE family protein PPE42 [Mycobacterium marinum]AXN48807.1 putative PPE family protein PPE42 [Mycobacterium marinum]EPQ70646.1 PPE family protein [Mycobacterium marinum str. Europe]RFZ11602.1 putative PPE family protein PPE42 [Mycobacterium marinum]WCS19610.1 PPE family protein [Mycobacterium marinum]